MPVTKTGSLRLALMLGNRPTHTRPMLIPSTLARANRVTLVSKVFRETRESRVMPVQRDLSETQAPKDFLAQTELKVDRDPSESKALRVLLVSKERPDLRAQQDLKATSAPAAKSE